MKSLADGGKHVYVISIGPSHLLKRPLEKWNWPNFMPSSLMSSTNTQIFPTKDSKPVHMESSQLHVYGWPKVWKNNYALVFNMLSNVLLRLIIGSSQRARYKVQAILMFQYLLCILVHLNCQARTELYRFSMSVSP